MSGQLTAIDTNTVYTSAVGGPKVGQYHDDEQGRRWQFVKAGGSFSQYDYVSITKDLAFTATGLTVTTNPVTEPGLVGCYQGSTAVVSGNYVWVLRKGAHTGNVSAATAVGVKMYTTGTAGKVSSTSTSQSLINGLTATVLTSGSGSTTFYANLEMTTVSA